ncbi:MAG: flippase-like domain-containing protein [Flavobacteriales bacterium]|jgi:glycosyltransferase 2 family protein|nr:flippase-like domain-containing protein [Flavobacteriales bacterium]
MKEHTNTRIFNFIKIIVSLSYMYIMTDIFLDENTEILEEDILTILYDFNKFKFVLLSMIFGAWAYVNRGLRWTVLIDALGYKSSKLNSVSSVSVGYFTNFFIPRAGEIARCTALNRVEKIPVDKLFGTILVERVIDFIFLIFFILLAIILKSGDIFRAYQAYLIAPESEPSDLKYWVCGFIISIIFIVFLFRNKIKHTQFYKKIPDFIKGIKEGFKSIKKMKQKSVFWFHTFSIWIMYFLMTYICFQVIPETSHLTISDGLFLLVLGGIGMVLPAPGGIGTYHFFVMIGLIALTIDNGFFSLKYNSHNPALLFPFIVHFAQTAVSFIMGISGMLMLFLSKKKIENE